MRWRLTTSAMSLLALLSCAFSAPNTPTTTPTTHVSDLLLGNFHGTVVDDDQTVPCSTVFTRYTGQITGAYVVRVGTPEHYEGTLDHFTMLSEERHECRFQWHDKHGEGFLTVRVTPDGKSFAGSWGLEVVQAELVWNGAREGPSTSSTR